MAKAPMTSSFPLAWMDVNNENMENIKSHPAARYVENFWREGDFAVIALDTHLKRLVGAAWCRFFSGETKEFCYIDDHTPELAIAVIPEYRSKAIGTLLLGEITNYSKMIHRNISLSVRSTNPAIHLHERLGFKRIQRLDFINRSGITSYVMVHIG